MKRTVEPGQLAATWDAKALYDKAERYVQQAQPLDKDGWDYALWTSLSLELLARAALANIHPALLAEPDRNGSNLVSALGFEPVESFTPKSVAVTEVFKRLRALVPDFSPEHESFGVLHTGRRNAELHSGDLPFDGLRSGAWQARFYGTCSALLASMGLTLADFVGADEAKAADAVMAAAADKSATAVKGDVDAHRRVWEGMDGERRENLAAQAGLWSNRTSGHRVDCPACGSPALVFGSAVAPSVRTLKDDAIVEKQEHLPTHFECVACGLKVNGLSRLAVVGLADRFTNTQEYDAAQFYAPDEPDWAAYEDDNNEP